jgi:hypothetical protein
MKKIILEYSILQSKQSKENKKVKMGIERMRITNRNAKKKIIFRVDARMPKLLFCSTVISIHTFDWIAASSKNTESVIILILTTWFTYHPFHLF